MQSPRLQPYPASPLIGESGPEDPDLSLVSIQALDGQLDLELESEAAFPAALTTLFFGGRSDNQANFEGRLDEIAIYRRALTAKEITRLATP